MKTVLQTLFVGLLLCCSAGANPNIIVVLSDDIGYGDYSCTGNPVTKTPNIDRLSNEGVRLNEFHVSPTCAPTRSALLTGRHEFRNGVTHTIFERERLTLSATTFVQMLKDTGYQTGIFGKWHLGDEDAYQPEKRGFDEVFIHGGGGIGQNFGGSCADAPGNTYFSPLIKHNGKFEKTDGYCTDVLFGQALKWIGEVKGNKPFFAYIPTNVAHIPLQVRPEDEARYAGQVPEKTAKFFGMIANLDDNVGRLMAKLKEWGIDDNTLVIYMSDNGGTGGKEIYNAGLRGAKGSAYQGGTRQASFWRWPGGLKPTDVNPLTAHIDIFPTLAELVGAPLNDNLKAQIEGRSLVPLFKNPNAVWPDRTLVTHAGRWKKGAPPEKLSNAVSIRNDRYSLVRDKAKWQLFDLQSDPGEASDIAVAHPDVVSQLSAAYDKWWDEVVPCMVNEDAWKNPPAVPPFRELYWKQYNNGAGPNNHLPSAADKGGKGKNAKPQKAESEEQGGS